MPINIKIVSDKEKFKSAIKPNFICNRYDILYKDFKALEIQDNEQIYFIPFHIEFMTCKLALWLVNIPQEILNEAVNYIFKTYKMVYSIKILSSVNPYSMINTNDKETNYWIDLPNTFEDYCNLLSKNERYNYHRHSKKLKSEIGDYQIVKFAKEEIPISLVKDYFKFKKLTLGKGYRLSPEKYLEKYCVTSAYALQIKGESIAIAFIVETDANVYLENITYNPKYSKYSVGITLLIDIISDLIKVKKKQFFLGASNKDDYKKRLSTNSKETYSFILHRIRLHYLTKQFKQKIFNAPIIKNNGINNDIYISPTARFKGTKFIINGDNNKIIIGDNAYIHNTRLLIGFPDSPIENCIVKIGDNTGINSMNIQTAEDGSTVTIGNNCMISYDVEINCTDHHSILDENDNLLNYGQSVEIGNHVWICKNVTIQKNSKIPDGCIVGQCSVVAKKIEKENCVIVGNPAKVVKENIHWDKTRPHDWSKR